jgi:two-component system, NtrC family, nitrogen regulation response regulator NtrX
MADYSFTSPPNVVAASPAMRSVCERLERAAAVESPVLLLGEQGTGKETLARLLHSRSRRAKRPFVAACLVAMDPQWVEGELFGYVAGWMPGTFRDQSGLIEAANGGTLFLDGVDLLSANMQAKLLRVLNHRLFSRAGGTYDQVIDVRVIAATDADLAGQVVRREFSIELWERLSVMEIRVPPLRDRLEDIPILVEQVLQEFCAADNVPAVHVSPELLEKLSHHAWLGNIDQMRNCIHSMLLRPHGPVLTHEQLPSYMHDARQAASSS